jgi:hypothetical protein
MIPLHAHVGLPLFKGFLCHMQIIVTGSVNRMPIGVSGNNFPYVGGYSVAILHRVLQSCKGCCNLAKGVAILQRVLQSCIGCCNLA